MYVCTVWSTGVYNQQSVGKDSLHVCVKRVQVHVYYRQSNGKLNVCICVKSTGVYNKQSVGNDRLHKCVNRVLMYILCRLRERTASMYV